MLRSGREGGGGETRAGEGKVGRKEKSEKNLLILYKISARNYSKGFSG